MPNEDSIQVCISYRSNSMEILRAEVLGEETITPVQDLVCWVRWRMSEKIMEEIFTWMNYEGSIEPVEIIIPRKPGLRSMTVGDQLAIFPPNGVMVYECGPNDWTLIVSDQMKEN